MKNGVEILASHCLKLLVIYSLYYNSGLLYFRIKKYRLELLPRNEKYLWVWSSTGFLHDEETVTRVSMDHGSMAIFFPFPTSEQDSSRYHIQILRQTQSDRKGTLNSLLIRLMI